MGLNETVLYVDIKELSERAEELYGTKFEIKIKVEEAMGFGLYVHVRLSDGNGCTVDQDFHPHRYGCVSEDEKEDFSRRIYEIIERSLSH